MFNVTSNKITTRQDVLIPNVQRHSARGFSFASFALVLACLESCSCRSEEWPALCVYPLLVSLKKLLLHFKPLNPFPPNPVFASTPPNLSSTPWTFRILPDRSTLHFFDAADRHNNAIFAALQSLTTIGKPNEQLQTPALMQSSLPTSAASPTLTSLRRSSSSLPTLSLPGASGPDLAYARPFVQLDMNTIFAVTQTTPTQQ